MRAGATVVFAVSLATGCVAELDNGVGVGQDEVRDNGTPPTWPILAPEIFAALAVPVGSQIDANTWEISPELEALMDAPPHLPTPGGRGYDPVAGAAVARELIRWNLDPGTTVVGRNHPEFQQAGEDGLGTQWLYVGLDDDPRFDRSLTEIAATTNFIHLELVYYLSSYYQVGFTPGAKLFTGAFQARRVGGALEIRYCQMDAIPILGEVAISIDDGGATSHTTLSHEVKRACEQMHICPFTMVGQDCWPSPFSLAADHACTGTVSDTDGLYVTGCPDDTSPPWMTVAIPVSQ